MGNAAAKLNGATVCDGGGLAPNGIYAQDAQDFDHKVVHRLILARHMAPFYQGADDPDPPDDSSAAALTDAQRQKLSDDGWWSYNLMHAQLEQQASQQPPRNAETAASAGSRSHSRQHSGASSRSASSGAIAAPTAAQSAGAHAKKPSATGGHARKGSGFFQRLKASHRSPAGSISSTAASAAADASHALASTMAQHGSVSPKHSLSLSPVPTRHDRSFSDDANANANANAEEACRRLLRRYIECPICFLYYPKNINYTRCCHKPICTECFVQIKRKLDDDRITSTHCPYCVQPNLGIIYYPPAMPATSTTSNHSSNSTTTAAAAASTTARLSYMRHRPRLSSQGSGAQLSVKSSATTAASSSDISNRPPPSLSESGRARSHSSSLGRPALVAEPHIVMTDDIRPGLVRELTAQLEAKHREQQRSAENMAMVAAATRRVSARAHATHGAVEAGAHRAVRSSPGRHALRASASEYVSYISAMRAAGQSDLEEFLLQQAIRISLAEQEEREANSNTNNTSISSNGLGGGAGGFASTN
ncbi:SNF1-interacting protein [Coemansia sp. Benny D115]|nr:SNF1-interacting protein [Coemansia sp. Benny D115]